jgi:glycolate oxidase iron-sulfur subunit
MNHTINPALFENGKTMTHAIEACVSCGFCLPACPTYQILGVESDSPRGRISLMKSVLENEITLDQAGQHLDQCLGCQACVTACPSGVPYGELLTVFRGQTEAKRQRPLFSQVRRAVLQKILPNPKLFALASKLGRLALPFKAVLPTALAAPLALLPKKIAALETHPQIIPAIGTRRARVAFLLGCAQQVVAPEFNAATLRVLARNGVEVVIPKTQVCCGAAAMHTGAHQDALAFSLQNLKAFPDDVDAIITNAAGCGSGLKEYPLLHHGLSTHNAAQTFAARVKDISVFLYELGLEPIAPLKKPLRVAYHDACHLAHAQGVKVAPRAILKAIPNLEILEIPEGDLCCGSAGTYNLEQPELAAQLGKRKTKHIQSIKPDLIASGNIGCHTQIRAYLQQSIPMYHTLEILDLAYRGEL